ncbi:hypothetical protein [Vacuolonema iberomarrocanum]|uniref:hypothetical protein n=1 Tax=Vacuolonema iberomarrocanum TaxID=3454632 RepID=UPI003F6E0284
MNTSTSDRSNSTHENRQQDGQEPVRQPLSPEQISSQQRAENQQVLDQSNPTVNPGDQVNEEKTLQEKAQQVAVNTGDITGDRVVVPTYFVVDDPEEGQKALHHVKDAEEISDVIRQARTDESGDRKW